MMAAGAFAQGGAGGGVLGGFSKAKDLEGGGPKVEASAVLDTTAITGGKAFEVAITLVTNGGWHVYWSNPGESGLATSFELALPPGFKADAVRYPVPHKMVMPGDVTVYGYEGKTTFLVKVMPPAVVSGNLAPLKVKGTWLNCTKEECVPGDATVEVPLKAGAGEKANEALFAAARAAIPVEAGTPGVLKGAVAASSTVNDGKMTYTVPLAFKEKVTQLEAYPDLVPGLDVSDIKVVDTEGETTIYLTARLLSGQHVKVETLPLVVAYAAADGKRRGLIVPLSLGKLQKPGTN